MVGFAIVAGIAFLYFMPSIDARRRKVPDVGMIFVINLLLGWTIIGWIIAMALAYRTPEAKRVEQMARALQISEANSGSMQTTNSAPPGWYPSPNNPSIRRWWDGSRWTEHEVDVEGKPLAPPPKETN
jgi:hypothetical protein